MKACHATLDRRRGRQLQLRITLVQPGSHRVDHAARAIAVGAYVFAAQVRAELLVAVAPRVEDQHSLGALRLAAEMLRAEKDAELQWHVEAGQASGRIQRRARE